MTFLNIKPYRIYMYRPFLAVNTRCLYIYYMVLMIFKGINTIISKSIFILYIVGQLYIQNIHEVLSIGLMVSILRTVDKTFWACCTCCTTDLFVCAVEMNTFGLRKLTVWSWPSFSSVTTYPTIYALSFEHTYCLSKM